MFEKQGQISVRVQIDIKGKMNRNELYREKNRGPAYVPRFVTPSSYHEPHMEL